MDPNNSNMQNRLLTFTRYNHKKIPWTHAVNETVERKSVDILRRLPILLIQTR